MFSAMPSSLANMHEMSAKLRAECPGLVFLPRSPLHAYYNGRICSRGGKQGCQGLITAAGGLDNRRKGVVSHELLRFRRACSRFFHRFIRISSAPLAIHLLLHLLLRLNLLLSASGTYLSATLFTTIRRELFEILVVILHVEEVAKGNRFRQWCSVISIA